MRPLQVIPSTTSHKREPLLPALEVFARLGMRDLDLNLNHFVERSFKLDDARRALAANGQRVWIASGGWCDFFDGEPKIEQTFTSVAQQVAMVRSLGVRMLRLFFGRLAYEAYSPQALETIVANIRRVADGDPDILFMFENHDGASSYPHVCREILEHVDRPNVRLTFDPINFEHRGVNSVEAASELRSWTAHVHLKGYERGRFCEFGAGEVDLMPALDLLVKGGYRGAFTVEYEGTFDRTLRLFEGLRNAEAAIERLSPLAATSK